MPKNTLTVIPKKIHGIHHALFPQSVLKVLYTLVDAGYEGYLVGGCLRDLLRGETPKDFDVVTNAGPDEIKALFKRQCLLIGRRFRLAHIYFGREYIEVATFRANEKGEVDPLGRVLRHNEYGDIESDVFRRDFTINALYYNIKDYALYDYVGAYDDIQIGLIRTIGKAATRYQEDPVRMLRAVRFQAKLQMTIESQTERAIAQQKLLISHVPNARLFGEVEKLFYTGHALASFQALCKYDLFAQLFVDSSHYLDAQPDIQSSLFELALANTDYRVQHNEGVSSAFLLAVFLWPVYHAEVNRLEDAGVHWHKAMHSAADKAIEPFNQRVAMPAYCKGMIRDIWTLQNNLQGQLQPRQIEAILQHRRFRAAYDFLELRLRSGEESLENVFLFWTQAQIDGEPYPLTLLDLADTPKKSKNKRKPRQRKKASPVTENAANPENPANPN